MKLSIQWIVILLASGFLVSCSDAVFIDDPEAGVLKGEAPVEEEPGDFVDEPDIKDPVEPGGEVDQPDEPKEPEDPEGGIDQPDQPGDTDKPDPVVITPPGPAINPKVIDHPGIPMNSQGVAVRNSSGACTRSRFPGATIRPECEPNEMLLALGQKYQALFFELNKDELTLATKALLNSWGDFAISQKVSLKFRLEGYRGWEASRRVNPERALAIKKHLAAQFAGSAELAELRLKGMSGTDRACAATLADSELVDCLFNGSEMVVNPNLDIRTEALKDLLEIRFRIGGK